MTNYPMLVQAGPDDILAADSPDDLIFGAASRWPSISSIVAVLPDFPDAPEAAQRVREWGMEAMIGDAYNVAKRMVSTREMFPDQSFCVRVLAIWKHVDFGFVDRLCEEMTTRPADLVSPPRIYDVTLAADVASYEALERVANMGGHSQVEERARFNPWGFMEFFAEERGFDVRYCEPPPAYSPEQVAEILADKRRHPENEFFGRDYSGSRYHRIVEELSEGNGGRVLDIACGSGFGSKLLSDHGWSVTGVDYLESYIKLARERYPQNERLVFTAGDGCEFTANRPFDMVVTLHTIEHVPDDAAMLGNLFRNLVPGGRLIAEVPVLAELPMGVPINPWHFREYRIPDFMKLVEGAGFRIDRVIGSSRSFYGPVERARDAVQVWATRPD